MKGNFIYFSGGYFEAQLSQSFIEARAEEARVEVLVVGSEIGISFKKFMDNYKSLVKKNTHIFIYKYMQHYNKDIVEMIRYLTVYKFCDVHMIGKDHLIYERMADCVMSTGAVPYGNSIELSVEVMKNRMGRELYIG